MFLLTLNSVAEKLWAIGQAFFPDTPLSPVFFYAMSFFCFMMPFLFSIAFSFHEAFLFSRWHFVFHDGIPVFTMFPVSDAFFRFHDGRFRFTMVFPVSRCPSRFQDSLPVFKMAFPLHESLPISTSSSHLHDVSSI